MGKKSASLKEKKEKQARDVLIKSLIHRICTPTSAEKRLASIRSFFKSHPPQELSNNELMHVWKGLFYAIWYSEMEKGCEEIMLGIIDNCKDDEQMIVCGFETISIEWFGIDSIRLDKFSYFVRQLMKPMFEMVSSTDDELICVVLEKIQKSLGLILHFCDIFVEEMYKISSEVDYIVSCLKPLIHLIGNTQHDQLANHVLKEVISPAMDELIQTHPSAVPKFKKSLLKTVEYVLNNEDIKIKKANKLVLQEIKKLVMPVPKDKVLKRKAPAKVIKNGLIYKRSKIPLVVN